MSWATIFGLQALGAVLLFGDLPAVELQPVSGEVGYRLGWREVAITSDAPLSLRNAPKAKSEHPLYLAVRIGSGDEAAVAAVLDESRGSGSGYDRLYLDANRNGEMTDDAAVRATTEYRGRLTSIRVDPVDMTVTYADGSRRVLRVRFEIRGYRRGLSPAPRWSAVYHLDQHLEGRVDIGDRRNVLIGLYDCSRAPVESNGCFDDFGVDRLRIDLNGDGKLDPQKEDFPLSRAIAVDGKLWTLNTDGAATRLQISRCTLPVGSIVFKSDFIEGPMADGAVELLSDDGYAFRFPPATGKKLVVPESAYRVNSFRANLADRTGQLWEATCSFPAPLVVKRDVVCEVAFGVPFRLEPVVEGELRPGVGICISSRLMGLGGELYENISPVKTRMEPRVSIIDAEDIVVLDQKMEYG